ncbi:TPA: SRPBCC family protein [Pseudomonas aeruginosa]|nr:SRPBCC family protein [Pseudomonas aeruginosa]
MDLDRLYLPHWQFSEHHQRLIDAPAAAVLDAVEDLLRFDDPLVRALLALREAPGRLAGLLGRRNDLAGRFWRADFALERIADGEHFRRYDQPGVAKLVLCFRCTPSAGGTLLHTETRVFCPDRASRLRFIPYWLAIRPVSGLIRRRLLAGIERCLG